ncbi:putative urea ABC transporter substrate-binding protein [candidate division CSSED10-310 bacterium]|uniref:Urea ABC transporter substrate-binding protein n=1 Tax=candidate division CSSED10-310 bacterium TaxID=2855610 RepID=A0ABV6Z497_UNCC1
MRRFLLLLVFSCFFITFISSSFVPAPAIAKEYKVAWSIYVGWMPWPYAAESGILKKWADKYGVSIKLIQADYIPTIEAFVAGQADACVMTNMEALDMPAANGMETVAVIVGDFSNGNDGILLRKGSSVAALKGKKINLVELSVSHYLLVRALEMNGMKEKDVRVVNTSDSDIIPVFQSNPDMDCIVTWNPLLLEGMLLPGVTNVYDSSKIPGEIIDMLVFNGKVIKENPNVVRAVVGAWYEVMSLLARRSTRKEVVKSMASMANCTEKQFEKQLETTFLYTAAKDAAEFTRGETLKKTMDTVRHFCFDHKLLGENTKSVDAIGVRFPDKSVLGNKKNATLIFDDTFMEEYAQGKISLK